MEYDICMYTDGAARGNPGPGGYGVVLLSGRLRKELSGGFACTTNNRMELLAVIVGLEALKRPGFKVIIYSDSQYVVNSISKGWLKTWLATDFKGGKKNKDLWKRYAAIAADHHITIQWVKGHAENELNNRCDELATSAADQPYLPPDTGYNP